jgi:hypothetical protein
MTDELIAMKGDDYGTLANTMLSLCEGHPAALALAAASAVVSRLIGTCSVSESEAILQAKHVGEQIVHNARIDWQTAHGPRG